MNLLLYLAEAFLVAYVARQAALRLHVPSVTGYVIGGVVLGGSFLFWAPSLHEAIQPYLLNPAALNRLAPISDMALGLIAFSIGAELHLSRIRSLGRSIAFIVLLEAFGAFACVALAIYWWMPGQPHIALVLGAVASATAPAATVAVINQYRARGPLTTTILAVVGVDDAIALIVYAFAAAISKAFLSGAPIDLLSGFMMPVLEVIFSLGLGMAIGALALPIMRRVKQPEDLLLLTAFVILLTCGLAQSFRLSSLLANMAAATVIVNRALFIKRRIQKVFADFGIVLYALFFITGGAHLDLSSIPAIGVLGLIYFVARLVGKVGGAQLGAVLGHAGAAVRKHIGFSLIPQVGAAVALALVVGREFGTGDYGQAGVDLASLVVNILLFTTILTEVLGPFLIRRALIQAGEARAVEPAQS